MADKDISINAHTAQTCCEPWFHAQRLLIWGWGDSSAIKVPALQDVCMSLISRNHVKKHILPTSALGSLNQFCGWTVSERSLLPHSMQYKSSCLTSCEAVFWPSHTRAAAYTGTQRLLISFLDDFYVSTYCSYRGALPPSILVRAAIKQKCAENPKN